VILSATAAVTAGAATNAALGPLDPKHLISFGVVIIIGIIFAETGLLIGFLLPGDSLIFLAGVAASGAAAETFSGETLPIVPLLIGMPIAAILGAQLGHWLGERYGTRLFHRADARFFRAEYVDRANHYFEKFGPPKAIVLARFIPIVRTFINPVAGTLGMPRKTFFIWNVIGGVLWTVGILLLGYFLGGVLPPNIDKFILPAVAVIVLISMIPIFHEFQKARKENREKRAA
jgi:membrane-associated protein